MKDHFMPDQPYALDGSDLARIRYVASVLFREDRLSADTMRDLAQKLEYSIDQAFPITDTMIGGAK